MIEIFHIPDIEEMIKNNLIEIGDGAKIDTGVWLCHWVESGEVKKVKIGKNCKIRTGTVIYGDVEIGDNVNFGQHVVVREGCRIGDNSSIGTGVKVENDTIIGHHTSIETQSHVTANAIIGNYVFWGACVVSNNDFGMKYKRQGHGQGLLGCICKDYSRIGSNAILMAGVMIGEHSIINAGETVRKDVPAKTLFFTKKGKEIYKKIKPEAINEK